MKKLLTIVICMITLSSNSQNTFKSDFYFGSNYYGLDELNNRYILNWGHFYFLNSSGVLDTFVFYKHKLEFKSAYSMQRFGNNQFVMATNKIDSGCNTLNIEPAIFKTDTNGFINSVCFFKMHNHCSNIAKQFTVQSDYKFLFAGLIQTPNYALTGKFYLFKSDSGCNNIQWAKNFTNHKGAISLIREVNSNFTLLGINLDTAGASLAKLDSMGNVLWCKSYFRPKGMITDAVVDTDGNIMCVGLTDTINWGSGGYPPWYQNKLFLLKVDTAGNIIYSKGYDGPSGYYYWRPKNAPMIRKTLDGNFMIGGTKFPYTNNPTIYGLIAMLMKIDGNGDTLWTRGYNVPNRSTELANFFPVSDGGYLLSGDFTGAISWPFGGCYVYKTDSLGYTSCGNVQELINIDPLFPTDSNVVLHTVEDSVSIIYSTIGYDTAPLAPYADDCIAVGMPQPQQHSSYNIYPNPTKGEIIIEMPSPLKRDSFVTVYNSMGKIVMQHAIKTEKDLQLDLSKYGKGIYLVKITEGDKESSSKVVVE